MPRDEVATTTREQTKSVIQTLRYVVYAQHLHPRSGELNGERNTVQAPAHLCNCRRIGLGQLERWLNRRGTLDEQANGVIFREFDRVHRPMYFGVRRGQRWDQAPRLTRNIEGFTTGRHDANSGTGAQKRRSQRSAADEHMLTVVENKQQVPSLEIVLQPLGH